MKIVFISDYYYPLIGGAEEVCRMEAEGLVRKGNDVSVITTMTQNSRRQFERIKNVKVYRVYIPNLKLGVKSSSLSTGIRWIALGSMDYMLSRYNPFTIPIIKQLIKKIRPDIVHLHNIIRKFSLSILDALHELRGELRFSVVFTAHDNSLVCPRATLLCYSGLPCKVPKTACTLSRKFQRLLIEGKVDLVIAPSKFLAERLTESVFRNTKVVVVPNPIERATVKYKNNGKHDDYTINILYMGRLEWYKGIHILINALRNLEYKNIKLHIAGKGSEQTNIERISRIDLRIVYHGFVYGTKKMDLLQRIDATIVPTLSPEPFPMVTLESFQFGIPVIASNIGGLPEVVKDGCNGRLFEPGNSKGLKKVIEELINDKGLLRKLKEGATESVKQYELGKHIEKLERIYEMIMP